MAAVSCTKDKADFPIAYSVESMGTIDGNTLIDDNGLVYEIVEVREGVDVYDMDRALAYFDVLRKLEDKRYSIRLLYLMHPLCKDVLNRSTAHESELACDPVLVRGGWISGGYINLNLLLTRRIMSDTKHMINLVYDDSQPMDTLRFTLNHNGFGEGFADEETRPEYEDATGIVCFNVSGMLPDGAESIPVKITAPWYETVEDDIRTGQTINLVTKGTLRK